MKLKSIYKFSICEKQNTQKNYQECYIYSTKNY